MKIDGLSSSAGDLRLALGSRQPNPQVDEIVTEDPQADPASHARIPL